MIDFNSPRARWKRKREDARNGNLALVMRYGKDKCAIINGHGTARLLPSGDVHFLREQTSRLINLRVKLRRNVTKMSARRAIKDMRSTRAIMEEFNGDD